MFLNSIKGIIFIGDLSLQVTQVSITKTNSTVDKIGLIRRFEENDSPIFKSSIKPAGVYLVSGEKSEVPKEIDKQVGIIFDNAKNMSDDMPFFLKPFKKESEMLLENQKMKEEVITVLQKAREIPGNEGKDVIELLKNKPVFDEVYSSLQANSAELKNISSLLNLKFVKNILYQYIETERYKYLLYGKESK